MELKGFFPLFLLISQTQDICPNYCGPQAGESHLRIKGEWSAHLTDLMTKEHLMHVQMRVRVIQQQSLSCTLQNLFRDVRSLPSLVRCDFPPPEFMLPLWVSSWQFGRWRNCGKVSDAVKLVIQWGIFRRLSLSLWIKMLVFKWGDSWKPLTKPLTQHC